MVFLFFWCCMNWKIDSAILISVNHKLKSYGIVLSINHGNLSRAFLALSHFSKSLKHLHFCHIIVMATCPSCVKFISQRWSGDPVTSLAPHTHHRRNQARQVEFFSISIHFRDLSGCSSFENMYFPAYTRSAWLYNFLFSITFSWYFEV